MAQLFPVSKSPNIKLTKHGENNTVIETMLGDVLTIGEEDTYNNKSAGVNIGIEVTDDFNKKASANKTVACGVQQDTGSSTNETIVSSVEGEDKNVYVNYGCKLFNKNTEVTITNISNDSYDQESTVHSSTTLTGSISSNGGTITCPDDPNDGSDYTYQGEKTNKFSDLTENVTLTATCNFSKKLDTSNKQATQNVTTQKVCYIYDTKFTDSSTTSDPTKNAVKVQPIENSISQKFIVNNYIPIILWTASKDYTAESIPTKTKENEVLKHYIFKLSSTFLTSQGNVENGNVSNSNLGTITYNSTNEVYQVTIFSELTNFSGKCVYIAVPLEYKSPEEQSYKKFPVGTDKHNEISISGISFYNGVSTVSDVPSKLGDVELGPVKYQVYTSGNINNRTPFTNTGNFKIEFKKETKK